MWVSGGGGARATIERLREHERVVRVALRRSTPLPLRYGTTFSDDADVGRALTERSTEFIETLDRLGDRIEMGLRIERSQPLAERGPEPPEDAPSDDPVSRPNSGRAYLEARREALEQTASAREEAAGIVDLIDAAFADMELPSVRSPGDGAAFLGGLAHLVHRDQLRLYRERVARLKVDRAELRVTLTGPWAPYSFV